MLDKLIDRQQLAAMCGIKIRQTYNLTMDKVLPKPEKIGNKNYWLRDDPAIVAFIDNQVAKRKDKKNLPTNSVSKENIGKQNNG